MKNDTNKYVIIIRHGEINNPKKLVYNRDKLMRSKDIIHLSKNRKKTIKKLGKDH